MRFAEPKTFQLLSIIPVILLFYFFYTLKRKRSKKLIGDVKLVEKMWTPHYKLQNIKFSLLILSCLFLILALARPQWGVKLEEVKRKGLDIMFIIDLSKSMSAEDVRPSRLERAKLEISSFLDNLKGDRVGICGFAGQALMICPLTLDYLAVKLFLDILNTQFIPLPGTKIAEGIDVAIASLTDVQGKHSICILITDGEDLGSEWKASAQRATSAGIKIYTVGIGTPEGEPIPERDESSNIKGYKKDAKGKVIMSRLDENVLQNIAMLTGGGYSRIDLNKVYKAISTLKRGEFTEKYETLYQDRFQWFLVPALISLVLSFVLPEKRKWMKKS